MGTSSSVLQSSNHTFFLPKMNLQSTKVSLIISLIIDQISGFSSEFVSKTDANSVLSVPDSYIRNQRAIFRKPIKTIKKDWNTICKFNSVEKWIEFKDELEDTRLPEKEVDTLERCTSRCYWT